MLEALKTRPITTDDDCHELTNEQLNKLAVGRKPVVFGNLTKEELDAELEKGMDDIRNGRVYTEAEVLEEMHRL